MARQYQGNPHKLPQPWNSWLWCRRLPISSSDAERLMSESIVADSRASGSHQCSRAARRAEVTA